MKTIRKEILIKGKPKEVTCVEFDGQTFMVSRGTTRVACLEEEWFENITDPKPIISALKTSPRRIDILTFRQPFTNIAPNYDYHCKFEPIGVLPIQTYDHWFKSVINAKTRNMVRKSEKKGLVVTEAKFDDEFVRGITEIFNETPIRQGRKFWHYGKNFQTVKEQFSRYLFREFLIGAYYDGELIGFMMLPYTKNYALTGQILSKIKHRDKATNNALIAMAVKMCENKKIPNLIYPNWGEGSFAAFKRHCGFSRVLIPRYFVPLT